MNRSNKRSYMYRENTDFQKDTGTERNETKRILASPSSILQYSIRRLIEFVEKKKKRKEKENYQMKISLRSNIRSIRVFRSLEYNQTFSNIEYRGERGREKKETAENRKEQLDKVRRKVRGKGRDQEPRSLGE